MLPKAAKDTKDSQSRLDFFLMMGVLGRVMAMGDPWYSAGVESGEGVDNAIGEGG